MFVFLSVLAYSSKVYIKLGQIFNQTGGGGGGGGGGEESNHDSVMCCIFLFNTILIL